MDKFNLLKVFRQSIITYLQNGGRVRKLSFTMAEILLSLTIIGVVAAITLPSLTGNINERTWATQKKALYARLSQAIPLMGSINGYGTLTETIDENGSKTTNDNAAKTFITEGLAKVLKINNICDDEHLADCGIPDTIHTTANTTISTANIRTLWDYNNTFNSSGTVALDTYILSYSHSQINTKVAAFETVNGENILVYYYPYCVANNKANIQQAQPYMCANFVYDLNGKKGPNTVGKDIGFISALYPTDSVVTSAIWANKPTKSSNQINAMSYCHNTENAIRLPNKEELMSIFYNKTLLDVSDTYDDSVFWANEYSGNHGTYVNIFIGRISTVYPRTSWARVRCIQRFN